MKRESTTWIINCLFESQCSIVRPKVYFCIGRLLLTDLSLCFYWFKHPSKCNLSSSHYKFLKRQFALDDVETFNFAISMQDWAASLVRVWSMKNCVLFFCEDSHEIQSFGLMSKNSECLYLLICSWDGFSNLVFTNPELSICYLFFCEIVWLFW